MSGGAGGMDLRLPIGGLFVVLGVILGVFGIITNGDVAMYERSGGLNINLVWGAVMLGFGIIFLGLAQRAARR
jgi:protein-S-isoprenylcysteine O-methyltransferase Ste14